MAKRLVQCMVVLTILASAVELRAQPASDPGLAARVAALERAVAGLRVSVAVLEVTAGVQQARITSLQSTVAALNDRLVVVETSQVSQLSPYLQVTTDPDLNLPLIKFTGVNLQLVNGAGPINLQQTDQPKNNGLGNLIIGYNEPEHFFPDTVANVGRGGSHNLVVGPGHGYASGAGIVVGFGNKTSGIYSSIGGGQYNRASIDYATVGGGYANQAAGPRSWAAGGDGNIAGGDRSSVTGGSVNNAAGDFSSVCGGNNNQAMAEGSSVSGGRFNSAGDGPHGQYSSVSGGSHNTTTGDDSSISGGHHVQVPDDFAWAAGALTSP